MTTTYRINAPHVVAETLEGETTIVDLEKGTYYALNPTGSVVWESLLAGLDGEAVAEKVAAGYGVEREAARADVERIVAELLEHGLMVPGEPVAASTNGAGLQGGEYTAPQLSVYTDMQELLLLDPIHEVDDAGWPSQA